MPPLTSPSPGCRVRGCRARHSLQVRSLRHSSGERGIGEQGGTPQPSLEGTEGSVSACAWCCRTPLTPRPDCTSGPAQPAPADAWNLRPTVSFPSPPQNSALALSQADTRSPLPRPLPLCLPQALQESACSGLQLKASGLPSSPQPQHRFITAWKCMSF